MKKYFLIILTASMLMLAGCVKQAPATEEPAQQTEEASETAQQTEEVSEIAQEVVEENSEEPTSAGKVIAPFPADIDTTNPADGIYNTVINNLDSKEDGIYVDITICTVDLYDAVDITTLQSGDTIAISGDEITVKTVEEVEPVTPKDEEGVEGSYAVYYINGSFEEGGIELVANEGGTFKYFGMDDYPTFTKHGNSNLKIADDAAINDKAHILDGDDSELTEEGVNMTTAEFADNFKKDFTPYSELNTTVRIEKGVIVEINRRYIP